MYIVRNKPFSRLVLALIAVTLGAARSDAYTGNYPPPNTDVVSAVPILATVSTSPPSITLNFSRSAKYQIFRKDPASTTWGTALVTLAAPATTWTDTSVAVGQLYEYKAVATDLISATPQTASTIVQLHVPSPLAAFGRAPYPPTNPPPYGYIMTGIQVDETAPKGRVILVVTTDVQTNLPAEVAQYQSDLAADGWFVHVISVAPAKDYTSNGTGTIDSTTGYYTAPFPADHIALRNQIIALYNQYPGEFKNVILLGKVPACRTGAVEWYANGNNAYLPTDPDGHIVNRASYGADGYYANMTGTWTDTRANTQYFNKTTPTDITVSAGTLNLAGDNKFDQYYMQETGGQADMGFGRIDLSNNIASQYEALRFYLNKLHRYKTASPDFLIGRKNFLRGGGFPCNDELFWSAAPAISGGMGPLDIVKNATPPLPVVQDNFDAEAAYTAVNGPYNLTVQGSGGPGVSIGGKGLMWTGMQSHWGWWYSTGTSSGENTMALRLGEDSYCLSYTWNIFGLRYFYHRMGMGFDTGDMARVSINNIDSYNGTYAWTTDKNESHGGYIAPASGGLFMDHFGDPTLHLYMFAPPTNLSVVPSGGNPSLSWTASTDPAVLGYHVYRQDSATTPYVRLTSAPVSGTSYVDSTVTGGAHTYMVRAVKLETTGGGTFYNASLGAQQGIDLTSGPAALAINSPATLPDIFWSTAYTTALTAQGGTPNYSWSLAGGTLPPGLTLNADGTFSGLATQQGAYSFTAQVTDALGQAAQLAFTVTVQSSSAVTILPEDSCYVYSSAPTRVQGPTEIINVVGGATINYSYLRFPLSGLNTHNAFVSAKLRLYVTAGTTASTIALLQASLSQDAPGAAWTCSGTTGMTYNTQPADNTSVAPVIGGSTPAALNYLDLDVTPLLATALAVNTSGKMSVRLSTATLQTIQLASAYGYGNARPQLIVQTTDAPLITLTAPTVNPAYLYAGSRIQFNATVSPLAARAAYLTTQWTQVSGPGIATFTTPGLTSTGVTFSTQGDYVIRLTANDGLLTSYKDTTVRVLTVPATGPTDSLSLRLPFDETTGTTAADASGVTPPNNATLYAGSASGSTVPAWSTGQFNGAVSFNQTGQRVEVADSATNLLDGTAQMTISFWVYANALTTDSTYRAAISKRFAAFNKESYQIALRNGTWYCDYGSGGSMTGSRALVAQKWTHVVFIYAGAGANNLQMYINGTPDKFATATGTGVPRNATSNLRIGAYDANDTTRLQRPDRRGADLHPRADGIRGARPVHRRAVEHRASHQPGQQQRDRYGGPAL